MQEIVFDKIANPQKIYCLYFSQKSLLSLDLNHMMEVLFNKFGNNIAIVYQEMNNFEKMQNSHAELPSNILMIDNFFNIYMGNATDDRFERLFDVEKTIIEKGQK